MKKGKKLIKTSGLILLLLLIKIYKTIILPVVLYGCETWSLTLSEVCRLRVFENRILRRIFGPKRDENGEWRRLHNEELHSLYRSPKILRVIKSRRLMNRDWSQNKVGVTKSCKPTGKKKPLGRPRYRRTILEWILKK